ncbi:MAG: hypothetical protein ACOZJX_04480 [Pseudomonadota bacterium]
MRPVQRLFAAALAIAAGGMPWPAAAEPPVGEMRYLCCNMRIGSDWLSDINYDEEGMTVVPYGTPVKVMEVSRNRVRIEIAGKAYKFGNDYSRKLGMPAFIERYLLAADPRPAQQGLPEAARTAIESFSVAPGMTREQVLLAIAYPIADETPDLQSDVWKYWRNGSYQYDVKFDEQGVVKDVLITDENSHDSDEKCPVNVYRPDWKLGDDRTHTHLQVDDKVVGRLRTSETTCLKLAPGRHLIEVRNEVLFMPAAVVASMEVVVPADGAPQFLRFQRSLTASGLLISPWLNDNKLTITDEASWRKRL